MKLISWKNVQPLSSAKINSKPIYFFLIGINTSLLDWLKQVAPKPIRQTKYKYTTVNSLVARVTVVFL